MGLLSAVAGSGLVQVVNGYLLTKESAALSQKAQLAMARMVRELTSVNAMTSGTSTAITFEAVRGAGVTETHTISWDGTSGSPVLLDADILVDNVNALDFIYVYLAADGTETTSASWTAPADPSAKPWVAIEVTLTLNGTGTPEFNARVFTRNWNRY